VHPQATLDQPNTFGGRIKPAPTTEAAVEAGEAWMLAYVTETSEELTAICEEIQREVSAERAALMKREAILQQQAAQKAQAASDLEAWKIRQQIESEQRYTTEASYKGLEPSLTSRLRNISAMGSTQRATQALKTQSRQLREGKRYQR
jgi:hypothetical protein